MPYLLMTKSYDYDDEFYFEQDGGYPELVFDDNQYVVALMMLDVQQQNEWVNSTPLTIFRQDQTLADLSSSGFDIPTLARAISDILGQTLSAKELLEKDFKLLDLSPDQQRLIGLLLDEVGDGYITFVEAYREV